MKNITFITYRHSTKFIFGTTINPEQAERAQRNSEQELRDLHLDTEKIKHSDVISKSNITNKIADIIGLPDTWINGTSEMLAHRSIFDGKDYGLSNAMDERLHQFNSSPVECMIADMFDSKRVSVNTYLETKRKQLFSIRIAIKFIQKKEIVNTFLNFMDKAKNSVDYKGKEYDYIREPLEKESKKLENMFVKGLGFIAEKAIIIGKNKDFQSLLRGEISLGSIDKKYTNPLIVSQNNGVESTDLFIDKGSEIADILANTNPNQDPFTYLENLVDAFYLIIINIEKLHAMVIDKASKDKAIETHELQAVGDNKDTSKDKKKQ